MEAGLGPAEGTAAELATQKAALESASQECVVLKQQLAEEQERWRQEYEAAIGQLQRGHKEAAVHLHAEHTQQLQELHMRTENAHSATHSALQQLTEAQRECKALQEKLAKLEVQCAEDATATGGGGGRDGFGSDSSNSDSSGGSCGSFSRCSPFACWAAFVRPELRHSSGTQPGSALALPSSQN